MSQRESDKNYKRPMTLRECMEAEEAQPSSIELMTDNIATKDAFNTVVVGALKACVEAHGNVVENSWIGSAAKRIAHQLKSDFDTLSEKLSQETERRIIAESSRSAIEQRDAHIPKGWKIERDGDAIILHSPGSLTYVVHGDDGDTTAKEALYALVDALLAMPAQPTETLTYPINDAKESLLKAAREVTAVMRWLPGNGGAGNRLAAAIVAIDTIEKASRAEGVPTK